MNLSSGYPLWFIRNGLLYDYPRLTRNIHCDAVVIGGGISGALMALRLQQAGFNTIVVDGRTIGLGSTCASTSLLQYELDTPLCRLRDQIGVNKANRAYTLCVQAVDGLRQVSRLIRFPHFDDTRSIYCAADEKHIPLLLAEIEARTEIGIQASWLDSRELKNEYGIHAPAAVISKPSAQTDAYAFTHALHQANITKGVKVFDRTYISNITRKRSRFLLQTSDGMRLGCRYVVYANGYEATEYIDKRIVQLSSTYAVAGEQMVYDHPLLRKKVLVWNTGNPYLYLRTTEDKRLVVGGRDEDFRSASRRDALIRHKSRLLAKDAGKLIPGIDFRPEFSWAGTFGSTKDSLPYIGAYPGSPGIYFALGFGGNGITFSYIAANIITEMILGKRAADAELFSFNR